MEGARKDYENHRAPNVNNRDEYRHPNVPKGERHEYRAGFERGYDAGVHHMMNGGPRSALSSLADRPDPKGSGLFMLVLSAGGYRGRAFSLSIARFKSSSFWPASPNFPSAVRR